jgi:uncharacterized protein (DUF488 family)
MRSSSRLEAMTVDVWTLGHSTRELDEFLDVLDVHRIEAVLDIRRYPGSRRLPHFEHTALAASLEARNINYQWLPSLGGRRRPAPDSPNVGWRHPAFRGYADHLATEEFAGGLFELLTIAGGLRSAILCAEVLWWRCHRRLVADVLTSLGERVWHIRGVERPSLHQVRRPARVVGGALTYYGS